jgi:hypothetical protein
MKLDSLLSQKRESEREEKKNKGKRSAIKREKGVICVIKKPF